MSGIKLVYFDVRGRAEPMRLAFAASGKKYENVRGIDWPAEKDKTPYGQVPYIEVNGKKYGESAAIASYVARETGMAGKTSEDAMRVDECFALAADLLEAIGKVHFMKDEAQKAEETKTLKETTIPKFMGFFEKLIKENGKSGYVVGSALTMGDLSVYDIVETAEGMVPDAVSACPEIQKLRKLVEANAGVKAYLASRKKTGI